MKRIALWLTLFAVPCAAQSPLGRLDFHLQNAQGQAVSGASVNVYTQPSSTSTLTISTVRIVALGSFIPPFTYYALVTFTTNVPTYVTGQVYSFSGLTSFPALNGQNLTALAYAPGTAPPSTPAANQALFLFGSANYGPASDTGTGTLAQANACGSAKGPAASLYTAAVGGTSLSQPILTNGFGEAKAYVTQGCYTVVYNSPYTGTLTYADQSAIPASSVTAGVGAGCSSGVCTIPQGGTSASTQADALASLFAANVTSAGTGTSNKSAFPGSVSAGAAIPNGTTGLWGTASQGELNGATYANPEAAVAAACAAGKAVYFPAGTYSTAGLPVCSNLHIHCSSNDTIAAAGAIFNVTGANWGLYNANADVTTGSHVIRNLRVENCGWSVAGNNAALGAWRIKGINSSTFIGNIVYGDNNPNPLVTEDGANFQHNNGDYDNTFIGTIMYDNAGASSGICLYVTDEGTGSGSNENKHYGGALNRCGTAIKVDGGNNNFFDSMDVEDWVQRGIWLTTTQVSEGTSATSLTVGTGTQTLTTQVGLTWTPLSTIYLQNGSTVNYMQGTVTSYDSGTGVLVANITITNGAGTFSSWKLVRSNGSPQANKFLGLRFETQTHPYGVAEKIDAGNGIASPKQNVIQDPYNSGFQTWYVDNSGSDGGNTCLRCLGEYKANITTWDSTVTYAANDMASYNDGTGVAYYLSVANTNLNQTPPTGGTNAGIWSSLTTYVTGQMVTYNNCYYSSLQNANLNHTPPYTAAPLACNTDAWWGTGYWIAAWNAPRYFDTRRNPTSNGPVSSGLNKYPSFADGTLSVGGLDVNGIVQSNQYLLVCDSVNTCAQPTLGTSTTSLTIGATAQIFTMTAGVAGVQGSTVTMAHDANNYMQGVITSYTYLTGLAVLNATTVVGSGTYATWTVTQLGGYAKVSYSQSAATTPTRLTLPAGRTGSFLLSDGGQPIVMNPQGTATNSANFQSYSSQWTASYWNNVNGASTDTVSCLNSPGTGADPVTGVSCSHSGAHATTTSVTAWSITSNVPTFTASNLPSVGATVSLSGFATSTFFNGTSVRVTSSGGGQFSGAWSSAYVDGSGTEAGTGTYSVSDTNGSAGGVVWQWVKIPMRWYNSTAATNAVVNQPAPALSWIGGYWNGAASAGDTWTMTPTMTNVANPPSTLVFSHTGSSGSAWLQFPAISFDGTNKISSQSSTGTQAVTCAAGGTSTQYCGADGTWHSTLASGYQLISQQNVQQQTSSLSEAALYTNSAFPNGSMGVNSDLIITAVFSATAGNAGNCSFTIRYGASALGGTALSSTTGVAANSWRLVKLFMRNRNNTGTQTFRTETSTMAGASILSTTPSNPGVNTATASVISFNGTSASGGADTCNLESAEIQAAF